MILSGRHRKVGRQKDNFCTLQPHQPKQFWKTHIIANRKAANWQQMGAFIDEAAAKGAQLVAFPEVVNILSEEPQYAETIPGPTTVLLAEKAVSPHNL